MANFGPKVTVSKKALAYAYVSYAHGKKFSKKSSPALLLSYDIVMAAINGAEAMPQVSVAALLLIKCAWWPLDPEKIHRSRGDHVYLALREIYAALASYRGDDLLSNTCTVEGL